MPPSDGLDYRLQTDLVTALTVIQTQGTPTWLTKPASVERSISGADEAKAYPAIFVCIAGTPVVDPDDGPKDVHFEQYAFEIWCVSQDAADPDKALAALVRDVRVCLRKNLRSLSSLGNEGWLSERGYARSVQKSDGRSGLGVAVVRAAVWVYTTDDLELA